MSFQVILIIHVLLALSLIALVLMQHGKGADAGAAFGAGASGSVFGSRGANSFIYKLTTGVAVGFFLTSLTLAYLATNEVSGTTEEPQSIMDQVLIDSAPVKLEPVDVPVVDLKIDKPIVSPKASKLMTDSKADKPMVDSKVKVDKPMVDSKVDKPTIDPKVDDIPK
ncbi:Protein translocase membrane subunit SecG [uncultured Gammaproteobacteria bacterium]|jgi:preprotein translocase subunit SecG|nr:Protein translocase membrane subunit SecG [uncultured Gammaproteobacteria bacterium]SHE21753.1 Preprotein translocase subunit SecG (TC 3.A.5.1.1) [Bathymodiolus brooksi thiotrophic gill symbiont]CAC9556573.1 Protein translocase membrane subunit SecG [uncultured Gammaproteobacteria bacterium]CAC9566424.1 Protein translocase membrane subunit SecG [uncultured Gammaproteobacteria bacterium]CAC9569385.1 Protein translocase membrane subunit SecG [uncultured Gammaproteobacteria bacterium]